MTSLIEDEDISLPFGANAENKALHQLIKDLENQALRVESELDENKERSRVMGDHLKSIQQELQQTQAIYDARKREVEDERHLKIILDQEQTRLKGEVKKISSQVAELMEGMNTNQNNIYRSNQRMEEIRTKMNWNQQQLEEWLEKTKSVQDDAQALEKYSRADEAKIKELSLQIEKLVAEAARAKKLLDAELTETHVNQIALEKAAENFRRIHQERQDLIGLWEQSLSQMQARDAEIEIAAADVATLKNETIVAQIALNEQLEFLKQEESANNDLEKQVAAAERAVTKARLDLKSSETQLQRFADEVLTLRSTLSKATSDLNAKKADIIQLKANVLEKKTRLSNIQTQIAEADDKLMDTQKRMMSAEEKAAQLDRIFIAEEKRNEGIVKELANLRDVQFKQNEQVQSLKRQDQAITTEIQASIMASKNMSSQITKLQSDIFQQQELLYNQDFTTMTLKRKLARLEGFLPTKEQDELKTKINELQNNLTEETSKNSLLSAQIRKIEDESRLLRKEADKNSQEHQILTDKLWDINMFITSTEQQIKKSTTEKQDMMVDENILKLEIRRLRNVLNQKADDVMSLEQQKLQLSSAMEERMHEINVHKLVLKAQLKATEEEKYNVNKELRDRATRIDLLKSKYEVLVMSIAPSEDGEQHSQAYYLVKAAQDRQELQKQGDELDVKIRKGEKEIRALQNTLDMMNGRNQQYRQTLSKTDPSSMEAVQREELDAQYQTTMGTFKVKRKEVAGLHEELAKMQEGVALAQQELRIATNTAQHAQQEASTLQKEIGDQEERKLRALKQASKLILTHRQQSSVSNEETIEEKDFRLRSIKDFTKHVAQHIDAAIHDHPDLVPEIQLLYDRAGIAVPAPSVARIAGSSVLSVSETSSRKESLKKATASRPSLRGPGTTAADLVAEYAKKASSVQTKTVDLSLSATAKLERAPSRSGVLVKGRAGASPVPSKK